MPLTWDEVEKGASIEDFRMDNVRQRIAKVGDLWKGLLAKRGRTNLGRFFGS
jgi:DNA primase